MGPKSNDRAPYVRKERRNEEGDVRCRHGEKASVRMERVTRVVRPQPGTRMASPVTDTCFQTSGCERMNFCCFIPQVCSDLLW